MALEPLSKARKTKSYVKRTCMFVLSIATFYNTQAIIFFFSTIANDSEMSGRIKFTNRFLFVLIRGSWMK